MNPATSIAMSEFDAVEIKSGSKSDRMVATIVDVMARRSASLDRGLPRGDARAGLVGAFVNQPNETVDRLIP
ncbi:hypothetical protein SS37A_36890 (plasmid) [Methylocystis iwaonis]|uniref:Uncharacterized protein n=1 Tax=Methylocystis iwaonis TaxID=2885079 RepID=A0ABN6VK93_9HYPH|nr:hypothetical protein SS37A_36890 [Methylocystis iwaonis]